MDIVIVAPMEDLIRETPMGLVIVAPMEDFIRDSNGFSPLELHWMISLETLMGLVHCSSNGGFH